MANSKLDAFADAILNHTSTDKEIAKEAGVTLSAVRAYRNRLQTESKPAAAAENNETEPPVETPTETAPEAVQPEPAKTVAKAKRTSRAGAVVEPKVKTPKAPKAKAEKKTRLVVLPDGVDKICPKCQTMARGVEEVKELFGYRTMENKKGEKKSVPQAWCRVCRRKSNSVTKAKKAAAAAV